MSELLDLSFSEDESVLFVFVFSKEQALRHHPTGYSYNEMYTESLKECLEEDENLEGFAKNVASCADQNRLDYTRVSEGLFVLKGDEDDLEGARMILNGRYSANMMSGPDTLTYLKAHYDTLICNIFVDGEKLTPETEEHIFDMSLGCDEEVLYVFPYHDAENNSVGIADIKEIESCAVSNGLHGGWSPDKRVMVFKGETSAMETAETELTNLNYRAQLATFEELQKAHNAEGEFSVTELDTTQDLVLALYPVSAEELQTAKLMPDTTTIINAFMQSAFERDADHKTSFEDLIESLQDDHGLGILDQDTRRMFLAGKKDDVTAAVAQIPEAFTAEIMTYADYKDCESIMQEEHRITASQAEPVYN